MHIFECHRSDGKNDCNEGLKMNNRMTLTVLGLASALLIALATPMTVQAGTVSIYNKD